MSEQWREVEGYEGRYSVSDLGRVRSEAREVANRYGLRKVRERVLKQNFDGNGYPAVYLSVKSKVSAKLVASLVLHAFRGPLPIGLERCHNDGNKLNSQLSNLRYDTRKNNHADKVAHGTTNRGEQSATAKLTAAQVLKIRADKREQQDIADDFGVSQTMVSRIKLRKAWAHI